MTSVPFPRRQRKQPSLRPREPRTVAGTLKTLGRFALWAFIAFALVKGTLGMVATVNPTAVTKAKAKTATWPDRDAEAFATAFTRAYLTRTTNPTEDAKQAARYTTPDLADTITPVPGEHPAPVTVTGVAVTRTEQLTDTTGTVTVAASTTQGARYLTVPLQRDEAGGLVVNDLPAAAAPPTVADPKAEEPAMLPNQIRSNLEPTIKEALTAYLAGDATALRFLTAPGAQLRVVGGYTLGTVDAMTQTRSPTPGRQYVAAVVSAKDKLGTMFSFRFRVVTRWQGDRWLVEGIS